MSISHLLVIKFITIDHSIQAIGLLNSLYRLAHYGQRKNVWLVQAWYTKVDSFDLFWLWVITTYIDELTSTLLSLLLMCVTCNILSFKQIATKRAVDFGGKKKSNFFALIGAKLFLFRHCNQEKGNEGLIENDFFHLSANLGHILDLKPIPKWQA